MEKQKGVTLLALIITIIVMIILIAIVMQTLSNNGILNRGEIAKDIWTKSEQEEKNMLSKYEKLISNYQDIIDGLTDEELKELFPNVEQWVPIYTKEQLKKVGSGDIVTISEDNDIEYKFDADTSYILRSNIDLAGENWISLPEFRGIFLGNNKIIDNLKIRTEVPGYFGLFSINRGEIVGVRVNNVDIEVVDLNVVSSKRFSAGAIVGKNICIMAHCSSTGNIISGTGEALNTRFAGGIAGENAERGIIKDCYNEAHVTETGTGSMYTKSVGGIAGLNGTESVIQDCYNKGTIVNGAYSVGGIAGYIGTGGGTIENCYNTGEVINLFEKYNYGGGIVGYIDGKALIRGCYNTGEITKGGGIAGISSLDRRFDS